MANFGTTIINGDLSINGSGPSILYFHKIKLTASNITGGSWIYFYTSSNVPFTFKELVNYLIAYYGYTESGYCRIPAFYCSLTASSGVWTMYEGIITSVTNSNIVVKLNTGIASTVTHTYTNCRDSVSAI